MLKTLGIGIFVLLSAALVLRFFSDPILSGILSSWSGQPIRVTGARWAGPDTLHAHKIEFGAADSKVSLEDVRVSRLLAFMMFGAMQISPKILRIGNERFEQSRLVIWVKGGVLCSWIRLESKDGLFEGRALWGSGGLLKAHGRVRLSSAGLGRAPRMLPKIFNLSTARQSIFALYNEGRILLRSNGRPVLEAAWQPG